MIRRPPRSTLSSSSAASDVYKRQLRLFADSLQNISCPHSLRNWQGLLHSVPVNVARCVNHASPVSYTHLRAHETPEHLVCRLLLEKKKKNLKDHKDSTLNQN
eukprot:TRINITY_DN20897_c0_g1_i1.p1 TRINITY_DN20897_c0_g1~~TRINITY_DN20897_c0_g1_i1.p1  ORF type:complete len:103 (+),score=23.21 TRINITY_DN20897_c0_g1_i1:65-373(+)